MTIQAAPLPSYPNAATSAERLSGEQVSAPGANTTSITISNSEAESQAIVLEQVFDLQASEGNYGDSFLEAVKIVAELFAKAFGLSESGTGTAPSVKVSEGVKEPSNTSSSQATDSPSQSSTESKLGFKEKLAEAFAGRVGELVYEDELQQEIISYQLYQKDPTTETRFKELLSQAKASGLSTSESNVDALGKLVSEGLLESEEAKWVNGLSFRAAQLDTTTSSLASAESDTGFLVLSDALKIAEASLAGIQAGGITAEYRELSITDAQPASSEFQRVSESERVGFLWKPESEADGKLVVLLPQSFTGAIENVTLYQGESVTESSKIEEGRFSGDTANGGRAHYRFDLKGSDYGEVVSLGVRLDDGRNLSFLIPDAGERLSYSPKN